MKGILAHVHDNHTFCHMKYKHFKAKKVNVVSMEQTLFWICYISVKKWFPSVLQSFHLQRNKQTKSAKDNIIPSISTL